MSPDHDIWPKLDRKLQRKVTKYVGKKRREQLINSEGLLFKVDENNQVVDVVPREDVDDGIFNDSLKKNSCWHLVRSFSQRTSAKRARQAREEVFDEITLETAKKRRGQGHTGQRKRMYTGRIKGRNAQDMKEAIDKSYPKEDSD